MAISAFSSGRLNQYIDYQANRTTIINSRKNTVYQATCQFPENPITNRFPEVRREKKP